MAVGLPALLHSLADRCRDLTKQIDLAAKLAGRVIDIAVKELGARDADPTRTCQGPGNGLRSSSHVLPNIDGQRIRPIAVNGFSMVSRDAKSPSMGAFNWPG